MKLLSFQNASLILSGAFFLGASASAQTPEYRADADNVLDSADRRGPNGEDLALNRAFAALAVEMR